MSRIFMSHTVADYDAWRAVYDDDAPRRAEAGIAEVGHFHSAADRDRRVRRRYVDDEEMQRPCRS